MTEEVIIWNKAQAGNSFKNHFFSILKINKPQKGSNMTTLDRMNTLNHFKMWV